VRGTRTTPRDLVASTFAVRAHEGRPVLDGTLRLRDDGTLVLEGPDAETTVLRAPPAAMREAIGARVWVEAAPDGRAAAWGVVLPRR
jgi:hypothetical protein